MRSIRFGAAAVALVTTAALAVAASPASADPHTSSGSLGSFKVDATYSDTTVAPGATLTATLDFTHLISTGGRDATYVMGEPDGTSELLTLDGCTIPAGLDATCTQDAAGTLSVDVDNMPDGTSTVVVDLRVRSDAALGDYPVVQVLNGVESGVLLQPDLTITVEPAAPAEADLAVGLDATAGPLLASQISYDLTAANQGPGDAAGATLTVDLPTQVNSVSNLPTGCSYSAATDAVSCATGAIANGGGYSATFRANLAPLSVGALPATATRTASSPTDPNPANDSATTSCTVVASLIIIC